MRTSYKPLYEFYDYEEDCKECPIECPMREVQEANERQCAKQGQKYHKRSDKCYKGCNTGEIYDGEKCIPMGK